ncbi:MAG: cytochrome-c peroxidase [Thiolinea sp.]
MSLNALQTKSDHSNQYAQNPSAAALGEKLFFDKRLSQNGEISCATCHHPDNYFTDGRIIALGQKVGKRNTPSLHGVAYNTWFFWDGRKDSLWSQALAPFENTAEHNFSRTNVAKLLFTDPTYNTLYTDVFGSNELPDLLALPDNAQPSGSITQIKAWKNIPTDHKRSINKLFTNTGKALAAFITTIQPLRTRFDDYVDAYNSGQHDNKHLNDFELAGLRLFISPKAQCINCHFGPLFTNQSFHNVGTGRAGTDSGRAAALDKIRFDTFNCLGDYSDASDEQCNNLKFMQRDRHSLWGAFKTPTLRNVSNTAPYFHDGRSKTLAEVIDHYTQLEADKTHLQALELSAEEKQYLIAFLTALTSTD